MFCIGRTRRAAQPVVAGIQMRFMATEKELKKRITSVESIKKITKASKMVAASKLRGVQSMLMVGRKFSGPSVNIWKTEEQRKAEKNEAARRALNPAKFFVSREIKPDIKTMIVPMTSDRGLCGGINSNVIRVTRRLINENEKAQPSMMVLGERGRSALSRTQANIFTCVLVDVSKQVVPSFDQAMAVASTFLRQEFNVAFLIWNQFRSAIAYDTSIQEIPSIGHRLADMSPFGLYEFAGDDTEILTNLAEFSTAANLYQAMLDNNTTEQSQKMTAMENSTKNAGALLDTLRIEYNRSRQSRITTELTEIISGAAALE